MKGEVAMASWSTMRGCLLAAAVWVMWQQALPVLSANAQGAAAIPKIVQAAPAKDSQNPLLKRIEDLERRVKELEDAENADVKDERSDDAQTVKIEARLASLEKAARSDAADAKSGGLTGGTSAAPVTVRAPFVVQGAGGRPLLRVDEVEGRVRAIVGDPEGARAVMGVNPQGVASVLAYDASNEFRAGFAGFPEAPWVRVLGKSGAVVNIGMAREGNQPLITVGTAAHNVVTIRATPGGFGELSIANNTGQNVVEAGTTKDGLGVVRAGPSYSCAAGSLTLPCQIIGRRLK
jgi:hypothetical protein